MITTGKSKDMTGAFCIKQIKKRMQKQVGPRCKKYAPLCFVCESYRALEILEYAFCDDIELKNN